MRQRRPNLPSSTTSQYSPKLKLPLKYEKRWRLNFVYKPNKLSLSSYDAFGTFRTISVSNYFFLFFFKKGNKIKAELNEDQFNEFEFIIHFYLDFCQKEKV